MNPKDTDAAPLRILEMCTMFGVGGISRHVLELSNWLRGRGHQLFFAGSPGPWLSETLDPDFVTLGTQGASGDNPNMASRLAYLATSAATLRAWLKRHPVDLIHAHESAPALVARLAAFGLKIPIAVTYHGSDQGRVGQFGTIARFATDLVLTVSHRSARDLASLGRVPAERLKVIGLGVKTPPPVAAERAATVRSQLLGASGRLLVVTVARLTEQKGVDLLVEVARRVGAERRDIHFAVVGDGPQQHLVQGWAEAAGVEANLHFVGRSEEPELYLAAADLFLLTSRWEALPFTIVEAFQMGVPALATDCGGVAELIDDSVGQVLPIGDVEAISRTVIALADDAPRRQAMSQAALARSREDRFSPDHVHGEIEQTYRDLARAGLPLHPSTHERR